MPKTLSSRTWPALAGLLAGIVVAACTERVGPRFVPTVQFGTGCPECDDTLSNDEWDDMQNTIALVEVQDDAPDICSSIHSATIAQGKWEWGKASTSSVSWSGKHFPSTHGTGDPHYGIREDYASGTYGSAMGEVMVHEQAHHMGWPQNHSAWNGLPQGDFSVENNCFWW